MRIFDGIGIATVAIWLGIISLTAWTTFNKPPTAQSKSDQVVLSEGESWTILIKDKEDLGYIHETRTQLETGWLLEYKTLISVPLLGKEQTIESTFKAHVDHHAVIHSFTSDLSVMSNTFRIKGNVLNNTLHITTLAGNSQSTRDITLTEPPRLVANAYNRALARPDLKKGDTLEETFFDPATMEMVAITLEYSEPTQTEVWGEIFDAHRFTQRTGNTQLNVIAGVDGTVLIHELPLDIVSSRVPLSIGRAKAMSLRAKVTQSTRDRAKSDKPADITLETARQIAAKFTTAPTTAPRDAAPIPPGLYTISNIPAGVKLQVDSNRQYITSHTGNAITIDTQSANAFQNAVSPTPPEILAPLLDITTRVDASAANIQKLVQSAELDKIDKSAFPENPHKHADHPYIKASAQKIADAVQQALKLEPNTDALSASQILESGHGDASQFALVTVAALRHAGIRARFVHGLLYENEGKMIPHQWIQYFAEKRFIDLDVTRKDHELSTDHIQLFTSPTPEHPDYLQALEKLSIQPILP